MEEEKKFLGEHPIYSDDFYFFTYNYEFHDNGFSNWVIQKWRHHIEPQQIDITKSWISSEPKIKKKKILLNVVCYWKARLKNIFEWKQN